MLRRLHSRSQRRISLALAVVWVGCPSPAAALESEWTAGVELGGAASSRVNPSPSLGLRSGYGLSSSLDIQLELTTLLLTDHADSALVQVLPALVYKFDVVRWIPYLRAGAGPALMVGPQPTAAAMASAAIGMDYLFDRSFSMGLAYQADWMVVGPERWDRAMLPLHQLLLSATWRSGW